MGECSHDTWDSHEFYGALELEDLSNYFILVGGSAGKSDLFKICMISLDDTGEDHTLELCDALLSDGNRCVSGGANACNALAVMCQQGLNEAGCDVLGVFS